MYRRLLIAVLFGLLTAALASAQTGGGQVCVRAFEDRNGNGQQDNNEPFITRGISATLADAQGMIVSSTLIEDSPNAANGTLCFQRLAAGQYTVRLASADYTATTPNELVTAVSESGLPQILPFGGQIIASRVVATDTVSAEATQQAKVNRLLFAGIGGVGVIAAMGIVGALIYALIVRSRSTSARKATGTYQAVRPPTGNYPPSRPPTGTYPAAAPIPAQAAYTLYDDDDTGKSRPINTPVAEAVPASDHLPYDDVTDFAFDDDDPDSPYRPPQD